jgi:aminopeptidase
MGGLWARFVSALYWDAHVKRSRLVHAPADSLDFVPDWWNAVTTEGVARRSAVIHLHTPPRAELLEDIPLERPCAMSCPMLRLDTPDPEAAWRDHLVRLRDRAGLLQQREFAGLHFRGGGTDLTVGLLAGARWVTVASETNWGQPYVSNLPTEEVFAAPDYRRTEGVVRATRPLQLGRSGRVVGLRLRFERGQLVDVEATPGGDRIRAELAVDPGAARLGGVALVDRSSAVGRSGGVFNYGLIDENATCHIALGNAYPRTTPGLPDDPDAQVALGFNRSACHDDMMIGGPQLGVWASTRRAMRFP